MTSTKDSARKKPLVCHFLIDHRIGGPHKYVEVCARYMSDRYESRIFTCGRSKIRSISLFNLRTINRYLYPLEVVINTLYIALIAGYYLVARRPVIFNIHGVHNLAPVLAGFLLRVPSVLLIHEGMRELRGLARISLFFLRHNRGKVLSVSKKALDIYGVNGEVVFSPVDIDYWQEGSRVREDFLSGRNRDLRLLFVGNLNPIKGLDRLLDALANFPRPVSLNVIGASMGSHSKYFADLLEQAKAAERSNSRLRITFLGWQETANIRNFLYDADLFVMPSLSEGCPIALIEAMATGCIPFVTDVGDVKQILTKILPEAICGGFDAESLNSGLMALLTKMESLTPEGDLRLRSALARIAKDGFDVPVIAGKIMDAYEYVESRQ